LKVWNENTPSISILNKIDELGKQFSVKTSKMALTEHPSPTPNMKSPYTSQLVQKRIGTTNTGIGLSLSDRSKL
jgi:hypothetical protein